MFLLYVTVVAVVNEARTLATYPTERILLEYIWVQGFNIVFCALTPDPCLLVHSRFPMQHAAALCKHWGSGMQHACMLSYVALLPCPHWVALCLLQEAEAAGLLLLLAENSFCCTVHAGVCSTCAV